jgi:VanZ like family/Concanavalin A-like lectin/glucanases superfamily
MIGILARWLAKDRVRGQLCLLYLVVVLIAGLWPLNPSPRNDVNWLGNRHGLRFGPAGIVISPATFQWPTAPSGSNCSLEVYVQPGRNRAANSILTFYTPKAPQRFRVFEWRSSTLLLYSDFRSIHREMDIANAFRPGAPVLITITSGSQGTIVYLNGVPAQTSHHMPLSQGDFSGQLILGTSPVSDAAWKGELLGLAIYKRELTRSQVLRHFAGWSTAGNPDTGPQEGAAALYTFREGFGTVVHNQLKNAAPDLYIPRSFQVPHKPVLRAPWAEFEWNRNYAQDIIINVAGFVPFGFLLCAYLSSKLEKQWAGLSALTLGVITSVTIEFLQVYLPTRTSSMTDVMTNTVGAALGILLYTFGLKYHSADNGAMDRL